MAFLRATWILFVAHLRGTALSRRALVTLLLVLVPVVGALLIQRLSVRLGAPPEFEMGWVLVLQVVVPLAALILGSAVVAEEVEDRTITYLLTRPIPRPAVLCGRWLATVTILVVLLFASALAVQTILASVTANEPEMALAADVRRRFLVAVVLGGAVYSAVFAAAGALLKRPVIVGLGYVFAVEGFLSHLPGSNQKLTIQYYLKSYLVADDPMLLERMERGFLSFELVPQDEALRTLFVLLAVALAFGSVVVARRQYVLPS